MSRSLPLMALAVLLALPAITLYAPETPVTAALRIVLASLAIGIIPGLLLGAVVGPLASSTALEWSGLSFAISFVVVQALTVVAILAHVSLDWILLGLWISSFALSLYLLARPACNRLNIVGASGQWLIALLVVAVSAGLYVSNPGPPYWVTGEDALHIAVIRRMMAVERPALDNLYWARDFIYTYPFPATHFFMALISRAADFDPIFVYQKIRFFWSPAALCIVYAAARVVFGTERAAFAAGVTAALLTLNGTFGPITATWGQLAPTSHASDVAMTLLLPALLLLAMHFVTAATRIASVFFFVATLLLSLTLAVVHVREVVQFLVYAGAACATYFLFARNRPLAIRFAVMIGATLALVVVYLAWHKQAVGHIDFVVAERRNILIEVVKTLPLVEYVRAPFLNPYFSTAHEFFFYRWFPVVLLLSPLAVLAYASRPLMIAVGASILAYMLIVRLPILAIPYVYATYYEILFTPVRNFLFFIYLIAGPLLLVLADAIGAVQRRRVQMAAGLAAVVGLWGAYTYAGPFFLAYQELFFLPIIGGLLFALTGRPAIPELRRKLAALEVTAAAPSWWFYALVAAATVLSLSWPNSPLRVDLANARWTPSEYLASIPETVTQPRIEFTDPVSGAVCRLTDVTETRQAAPTRALLSWARQHLPTDAVLVTNLLNVYALPVFLPQHILLWPIVDGSTIEFNSRLVPANHNAYVRVVRRHESQPFLNTRETLDERVAYMREVGATHVVIDPMYYAEVRPFVAQWADRFAPVYDDGERWAVLELRN